MKICKKCGLLDPMTEEEYISLLGKPQCKCGRITIF